MEKLKLTEIKPNPSNPRTITDDKLQQLVKSVKDFPQMLSLRPIVIDKGNIVLGGNMRLQACKIAGIVDIPVLRAENLTEQQKQEFIIKDNVGFGEWDWETLSSEWDTDELSDWGLDVPNWEKDEEYNIEDHEEDQEEIEENIYTNKIEAPIYEPKGEKPELTTLFDTSKFDELKKSIGSLNVSKEEKEFLLLAASRHIVFNYARIAEFYAHSKKETQGAMEDSALVIIDFDKAVEKGYVKLSDQILKQYQDEYE